MYYKIYRQSESYYYIKHYKNIYDYKGSKIKVSKRDFLRWSMGKIDKTNYSKIEQIQVTKNNQNTYKITDKQKIIMDYVSKTLQNKSYILESSISIDNISKALTSRTVRDEDILKQYNLRRTRATKEIKESLGITDIKGYPFLIVKK